MYIHIRHNKETCKELSRVKQEWKSIVYVLLKCWLVIVHNVGHYVNILETALLTINRIRLQDLKCQTA